MDVNRYAATLMALSFVVAILVIHWMPMEFTALVLQNNYVLSLLTTFFFFFEDIDECVLGHDNCAQVCINTDGSFLCYCDQGFRLDTDQISCNGMHAKVLSFHTVKSVL